MGGRQPRRFTRGRFWGLLPSEKGVRIKEFSRGVLAKRDRKLCDTDPASKQPVGRPRSISVRRDDFLDGPRLSLRPYADGIAFTVPGLPRPLSKVHPVKLRPRRQSPFDLGRGTFRARHTSRGYSKVLIRPASRR